jgi:hypothetical protein
MRPVRIVRDDTHRKFRRADMQMISKNFSGVWVGFWNKSKQFPRKPYGLFPAALFEGGSPSQSLKKPGVGLPPANRAVAQNLGRHFPEKSGLFRDEMTVLLIDRRLRSYKTNHPALKLAEVTIFLHLGVINEMLASDPT